ncbi:MAG TPA: hypothetical protein VIE36_18015 [Methylomirabilota bacterium]|jgi:hypothetical protein
MNVSQYPSSAGHPRLEPQDKPSLQTADLAQRNRRTRWILLAIVAVLTLATLLSGIRW